MKLKSTLLVFLVVLTSIGFSQKKTVKTNLKLTEHTFYIRSVSAQKYIDLSGYGPKAEKKNGSRVKLWDLDDGNDRKVTFIPTGDGYYNIRFQHTNANLDVHGCYDGKWFCKIYKKDKGAPIQIWAAGNSTAQQWKIEQIRPGKFRIINRYSGKVLDASGNSNGSKLIQWTWHGRDNQLWEIIDVKTATHYQE